jgi:hypothetical protein
VERALLAGRDREVALRLPKPPKGLHQMNASTLRRALLGVGCALALAVAPSGSTAAEPVASAAKKKKKLCCTVVHTKETAVASGYMTYPKGATFLYGGMQPPIGACKTKAGPRKVHFRREFDLDRTKAGKYRFTMVYRYKGGVRTKNSSRFSIRGRGD